MYLEEGFSYYAQALESYHSRNSDYENKQMEQSEYDRRIRVILNSLDDEEIKKWLEAKIGGSHANNKSFLQRIIEIVTKHPQFLNEATPEKIEKFAKEFRNMRNSLTHQNSKKDSNAEKLFSMKHHAKVLIESIYLSEMEFDAALIDEIIQKRRNHFRLNF